MRLRLIILVAAVMVGFVATDESVAARTVFLPTTNYLTGSGAQSVAINDFNGDSHPDLAVLNSNIHTVSLLKGLGNGNFDAAQDVVIPGTNAWGVLSGDFNHDSKADLVYTDAGAATVWVLLGKGDGDFQTAQPYALTHAAVGAALGYFNQDNNVDLAVATDDDIDVLLGTGTGGFGTAALYGVPHPFNVVTVADIDGDGHQDLVGGGLFIDEIKGNGDGTFQYPASYNTGGPVIYGIAAVRLNDDPLVDVVTAESDGAVCVRYRNAGGVLALPICHHDGGAQDPFAVGIVDTNTDGLSDVVVTLSGGSDLFVFENDSVGGLLDPLGFTTGSGPAFFSSADFNSDGQPDLATANTFSGNVSVMINATQSCIVPKVIGLRLAAAKLKIRNRHCSIGAVQRRHSKRVGRVIGQSPKPGTKARLPGFPVRLVVGRR